MQHIAYKYRLNPTKQQTKQLSQFAGATRWLWNYMLDLNIKQYQFDKTFIFAFDMNKLLPDLKKQHSWLKDVSSHSLQQKNADLGQALKRTGKKAKNRSGFPKFKKKYSSVDSFRIPQINNHIKVSDSHITIPKIGAIRWKYHRPITGKLKSITVSRDIDHWYVSVLCDIPETSPITETTKKKTIGIDVGVANFATYHTGEKVDSPNFLKKRLKKLKIQQRKLSKKQKGSNNRRKQADRVARLHRKVRNQRKNWLHQLTHEITRDYDVICVEDLKIRQLLQKKIMSRAISDQGWGIFVNQLAYKCQLRGKHLTKINTYAPSTKTCSSCGQKREMTLRDRVYECQNTSCTDYLKAKDRDHNAAINIRVWGVSATNISLEDESKTHPPSTPGTGGFKACGDTNTGLMQLAERRVSVKQEAAILKDSQ